MLPLKDENPTSRTPVLTWLLVAACVAAYFVWQPSLNTDSFDDTEFSFRNAAIPCEVVEGEPLTEDELRATFGRSDLGIPGEGEACGVGSPRSPEVFPDKNVWLAVLTSMFLHGGLLHLGGNMLFLWIFGNNVEDHLGHARYLAFYVVGGVVATLAHVVLNLDSTIPLVGASGAIAAVMGAYLVWFPEAPVRTAVIFFFITVITVRAKWLLIFWFVLQFFTSPNSGVAWAAHVGGFVFGVLIGLLVRASRAVRRATWTSAHQHTGGWDPTGRW